MTTSSIRSGFDLSNKVAIITGSTRGIGESIAKGFLEFGAKVVISGRKQEDVDLVSKKYTERGFEVFGLACHVGDENQLANLVDQTIKHYGQIDILVNNAATNPIAGPIEEMSGTLFDKMMLINVKAGFSLCNLVLPYMKHRGGSIIHIGSVEGLTPSVGMSLYSMNKAALIMLMKSQAKEWGRFGMRSNMICPGLVKTHLSQALWQNTAILQSWNKKVALERMAEPDEIAGLAVFLASDASSYCTGQEFIADGGYMIS